MGSCNQEILQGIAVLFRQIQVINLGPDVKASTARGLFGLKQTQWSFMPTIGLQVVGLGGEGDCVGLE